MRCAAAGSGESWFDPRRGNSEGNQAKHDRPDRRSFFAHDSTLTAIGLISGRECRSLRLSLSFWSSRAAIVPNSLGGNFQRALTTRDGSGDRTRSGKSLGVQRFERGVATTVALSCHRPRAPRPKRSCRRARGAPKRLYSFTRAKPARGCVHCSRQCCANSRPCRSPRGSPTRSARR